MQLICFHGLPVLAPIAGMPVEEEDERSEEKQRVDSPIMSLSFPYQSKKTKHESYVLLSPSLLYPFFSPASLSSSLPCPPFLPIPYSLSLSPSSLSLIPPILITDEKRHLLLMTPLMKQGRLPFRQGQKFPAIN